MEISSSSCFSHLSTDIVAHGHPHLPGHVCWSPMVARRAPTTFPSEVRTDSEIWRWTTWQALHSYHVTGTRLELVSGFRGGGKTLPRTESSHLPLDHRGRTCIGKPDALLSCYRCRFLPVAISSAYCTESKSTYQYLVEWQTQLRCHHDHYMRGKSTCVDVGIRGRKQHTSENG